MASPVVYDEIKTELQAQFSPTYPVVDFDQIDLAKEDGVQQAFMALEEVAGDEQSVGFGDRSNLCQREEGTILVHFYTPAPNASSAARTLAASVATHMRHRHLTNSSISFVSPPDIGIANEGIWTSSVVALNYRYDFHVAAP